MTTRERLLDVLNLARWAPSGDNTQPWRFELTEDGGVAVHGHDTRTWCIYDFDGHASHMAHGALLETLCIAASGFGLATHWTLRDGTPDDAPIYDVRFLQVEALEPDPLFPFIEKRCVQRRPMQTLPLDTLQTGALAASVGPGYQVDFLMSAAERRRVARLLWDSAYVRLTCPEAYETHCRIIEWGARYSKDRIPERAVGVDPLTGKLMRWALHSWARVELLNRYLFGTVAPRIMLDYLPGVRCAAHVMIRPLNSLITLSDYVDLGRAMQRFWLTATQQGLHLQPEMTPLIFRWYVRHGRQFSASSKSIAAAEAVATDFEEILSVSPSDELGFFCRVGYSRTPDSRSLRLELEDLLARQLRR